MGSCGWIGLVHIYRFFWQGCARCSLSNWIHLQARSRSGDQFHLSAYWGWGVGLFRTHVSRVAPGWDLWRTLYRLSYSAAASSPTSHLYNVYGRTFFLTPEIAGGDEKASFANRHFLILRIKFVLLISIETSFLSLWMMLIVMNEWKVIHLLIHWFFNYWWCS